MRHLHFIVILLSVALTSAGNAEVFCTPLLKGESQRDRPVAADAAPTSAAFGNKYGDDIVNIWYFTCPSAETSLTRREGRRQASTLHVKSSSAVDTVKVRVADRQHTEFQWLRCHHPPVDGILYCPLLSAQLFDEEIIVEVHSAVPPTVVSITHDLGDDLAPAASPPPPLPRLLQTSPSVAKSPARSRSLTKSVSLSASPSPSDTVSVSPTPPSATPSTSYTPTPSRSVTPSTSHTSSPGPGLSQGDIAAISVGAIFGAVLVVTCCALCILCAVMYARSSQRKGKSTLTVDIARPGHHYITDQGSSLLLSSPPPPPPRLSPFHTAYIGMRNRMSAAASSAAVSARFPPPPPPDDVEVEVQENARVKRTAAQEERRERLRLWSHNRDARTTAHTAAVQGTVVSTLPIPDAVHHYLLLLPPGLHPAVSVAGGVEDKRRKVVKRKGRKKGRKRSGSREKRISLSQPSRVAATVAAARKPVPVPVLTTAAVQPVPAPNAPTVALQEKLANLEMKMNAIERGALLSRARAAVGDGDDHSSDSLASLL